MQVLLALVMLVAAGCTAIPSGAALAPDAALRGLTGAGYACDAGTSEAHSETIAWSCRRDGNAARTSVAMRGTVEALDSITVGVPRATAHAAARMEFGAAVRALGLPDPVASIVADFITDWDGGTVGAEADQTSMEVRTAGDELQLIVDLAP